MTAEKPNDVGLLTTTDHIFFIAFTLLYSYLTALDDPRSIFYTCSHPMPITKQAKKKQRRDRKITKKNVSQKRSVREAVKNMRKKPTAKNLRAAYTILDKATKLKTIHKNKASRLKSRLSKLIKKSK